MGDQNNDSIHKNNVSSHVIVNAVAVNRIKQQKWLIGLLTPICVMTSSFYCFHFFP